LWLNEFQFCQLQQETPDLVCSTGELFTSLDNARCGISASSPISTEDFASATRSVQLIPRKMPATTIWHEFQIVFVASSASDLLIKGISSLQFYLAARFRSQFKFLGFN